MNSDKPSAASASQALQDLADPKRAQANRRFFKTGPGEYGEGDLFLGVPVPQVRQVSRAYFGLSLVENKKLLCSPFHEVRLLALLILVHQFQTQKPKSKQHLGDLPSRSDIFEFYLQHTRFINNWDLVDSSASQIVGAFVAETQATAHLFKLAGSSILWERRISIISTLFFIRQKELRWTFKLAGLLLQDSENLMQKAVGWMLREAGKKDRRALLAFLDQHASGMPRTMLSYAIEHFSKSLKKKYRAL